MKSLKCTAITLSLALLTGTALVLNAQPSGPTIQPVDALKEQPSLLTNSRGINGAIVSLQKGQYGYWVKLARAASVRDYPGGKTIIRDGKPVILKAGQWFHMDPGVGTAAWALGYACVGGGRGCNRHNSVPGFILRSALSSHHAAYEAQPSELFASILHLIPVKDTGGMRVSGFAPTLFSDLRTGAGIVARPTQERRICAREAWFRDDKLHRIGILRKGDSVIVERYTDGAENDGRRRWAIGRGVGRGIQPNRNHGRVLVTSLCS